MTTVGRTRVASNPRNTRRVFVLVALAAGLLLAAVFVGRRGPESDDGRSRSATNASAPAAKKGANANASVAREEGEGTGSSTVKEETGKDANKSSAQSTKTDERTTKTDERTGASGRIRGAADRVRDYSRSHAPLVFIAVSLIGIAGASGLLLLWLRPPERSTPGPKSRPIPPSVQPVLPAPPLPPLPPAPPGTFIDPTFFVKEGVWKAVSASVQGSSHLRTKQDCQDASYCRILAGHTLIGAVCDGAGSARLGREGAQIAALTAVNAIASRAGGLDRLATTEHWHGVLRAAMDVARAQIAVSCAMHAALPREFATTLLLFVARPGLVVASQIGDGAVIVRDTKGQLHPLTTPQSGEYANTTTFLVSPDAFKNVQQQTWEGSFSGIAAFTDGLQRLALVMPSGSPHAKFFEPLFGFADQATDPEGAIAALNTFLRSDKVRERTDDDLTIMLARLAS